MYVCVYLNTSDKDGDLRQRTDPNSRQRGSSNRQHDSVQQLGLIPKRTDRLTVSFKVTWTRDLGKIPDQSDCSVMVFTTPEKNILVVCFAMWHRQWTVIGYDALCRRSRLSVVFCTKLTLSEHAPPTTSAFTLSSPNVSESSVTTPDVPPLPTCTTL